MSLAGEKAVAYHNLATLLSAGVPVRRALDTAGRNVRGPLRRGLAVLIEHVGQGETLAEAMARDEKAFGPLDRRLVAVAEHSGRLSSVFDDLADWYRFREQLRRELIAGLAMPVLVLHVAAVVIPLPGLFLDQYTMSQFAWQVAGLLALFYVPVAAIWAVATFSSPTGRVRATLDALAVRVPVVGSGVRNLALARFLRSFHALHSAGADIVRAMETALAVGGNRTVMASLAGGLESARQGHVVSEGFSRAVPSDIRQGWITGEESGNLDKVTATLAAEYTDRARHRLQAVATWLPRVLYLLLMIRMAVAVVQNATLVLRTAGL